MTRTYHNAGSGGRDWARLTLLSLGDGDADIEIVRVDGAEASIMLNSKQIEDLADQLYAIAGIEIAEDKPMIEGDSFIEE